MGIVRREALVGALRFFDLAFVVVSFIATSLMNSHNVSERSLEAFMSQPMSVRSIVLFASMLTLWYALFSLFGMYESRRLSPRTAELFDILKANSIGVAILLPASALLNVKSVTPRFLALFWLTSSCTAVLSRRALRFLLEQTRRRGRNLRNVLIVGTNPRAVGMAASLETNHILGYRILGFVDLPWQGIEEFHKSGRNLACELDELPEFLRKNVVDEVIIAWPMKSLYQESWRVSSLCEEQGLIVRFVASLFEMRSARATADQMEGNSLITLAPQMPEIWVQVVKRFLDIAISFTTLFVLAPVFLLAALTVKLSSRGPVFFKQRRVGFNKRIFAVYKFRTMVVDAEKMLSQYEHLNEVSGPVFKIKNDPRITRVGRLLRRSSIDELPQLLNVLKGEMSLVGPRPLPERDYKGFDKDWQRRRFCVRPGITCLWQIKGRSSLTFDRWMELDMEYIDSLSIWLDLEILVRTIPAVLRGTGAA